MRCILGIDPGISGAIVLHDATTGETQFYDMPTVSNHRGAGGRSDVDGYALGMLVDSLKSQIKHAFIEQVGGIGKQSAANSFQFGLNTGIVHGILFANLVPITLVTPQKWKQFFNLKRGKDQTNAQFKSMSRAKASSIMPAYANQWALAKHDGRAEALLIALYGAKHV